jgi:hypothetical protein
VENNLLLLNVRAALACASSLLLAVGSTAHAAAPQPGAVVAWGDNATGQSTVPPGLGPVIAISAGHNHSLALRTDRTVVSWGCSNSYQGPCAVPPGLTGVVAIAAGQDSLALKSDGTVVEWPCGTCVPAGLSGVTAIANGSRQLALKSDGTVVAWGDSSGEIKMPENLSGIIAISVAFSHDLALKNDGTVVGWGLDGSLQSTVPRTLTGVIAIAAGGFHSLALKSDGTVTAWGCAGGLFPTDYGQCRVPAGLSGVTAIAGGGTFSLALKSDGTVVAWGLNDRGQTTLPAGLGGVRAIAGGGTHGLAIVDSKDGSLAFDGKTAFAETPASANLNLTGDWTVEAWFKDEDPNGFNHPNRTILSKGDPGSTSDVPFMLQVGHSNIIGGLRAGGQNYLVTWDLNALGLKAEDWHHVAVTFNASLNVLNLWLDGNHIAYKMVPGHSTTGNTQPLDIGRKGPVTGNYWLGKLDDIRIWDTVRAGTAITAGYRTQLTGVQPGLVANWRFDEAGGTTAADSSSGHPAELTGGATFSPDVHP